MSAILVVEDDAAILRGLRDNLAAASYDVLTATDGEAGYMLAREHTVDLIVLDLMLPRLGGYELCKRLRGEGLRMPILILTARGEETDRVLGLDLGADDYVTKPFSIRELLARIRALLRRSAANDDQPATLQLGDAWIDFRRFEARKGDHAVSLTRKEFGLLRMLATRPGEPVSRRELLDRVWDYKQYPTTRTVDNHVASLRTKLEDNAAEPVFLVTVHGVGYKLAASPPAADQNSTKA